MERGHRGRAGGGGGGGGGRRGGYRGRGSGGGGGGDQNPLHYQQRWSMGQGGSQGHSGDGGGPTRGGGGGGGRNGGGGGDQNPRHHHQRWSTGQGGSQDHSGDGGWPTMGGSGGGGGRGRGRGREVWMPNSGRGTNTPEPSYSATVTTVQTLTPTAPESQHGPGSPSMQSEDVPQRLSPPPPPPVSTNKDVPVQRPDKGGTLAIRTANLWVNHFPVRFSPESIIRHYDVDVKPETPPKHGRAGKITKANLANIRNKFFNDDPTQFPLSMTAYDGEKNIFSAVPLPTGKFKVEYSEAEDTKKCTYIFTIKLVNELKLCKLKDYLSGSVLSIPRDILQGMDVVMKENPVRRMIPVGRSFHPMEAHPQDDLGYGITASRGFQHSLKPTFQGLAMCLDYSVLAFRKRLPVIDFLKEHIHGFNLNNFRNFRRAAENALKGLKVTMTHRITKQKYSIVGLTLENTQQLSFKAEDPNGNAPPSQVTLIEYFRQKYKKNITYKDIPSLDLSKNNRKNYVPMEFCVLVEGQIYPKENLDRNAAVMLKNMSLAKPKDRENIIRGMVSSADGPCGGGIIQNFGMEVDMNMTSVRGRVIGPPELKLGSPNGRVIKVTVDKEKCQWNLVGKGVVEGKPIDRWVVIDFSSADRFNKLNSNQFIPKLIARCKNLGIDMQNPVLYVPTTMRKFSSIDDLCELIEGVTKQASEMCRGRLQILICVMSKKDPGYKYLKWISETRIGVVTQCCLSFHANKGQDQYLANLALKINAKLGGSNVELIGQLPYFGVEDYVMFIGADVNHPGARNTTSPSIAAVVGTVNWPAANRYAARVRPQYHRSEKILNFGDMCLELVESYARLNKVKPGRIMIFRDGVSEGQFDMVLNEELVDLKRAFKSINYAPTITLIVAQKRHQTRLFPVSEKDGSSVGNVSPGTVVDTQIVHPFEFDFYLCSHYGSLGTSKPTHYHVLWDEHHFSSDQLQKLIYNMCFTFSRCTKPVSLVPPVYYADLVAYRGRMYYEAIMEGQQSPASAGSSSSSVTASSSLSSAASLDDRFYRLHADLQNIMFFV